MNGQIIAALFQEKTRLTKEIEKLDAAMEALGGESSLAGSHLASLRSEKKGKKKIGKAQIAAMIEGRKRARAARILQAQTDARKKTRNVTPEGRRAISESSRRMWEARRAAKAAAANPAPVETAKAESIAAGVTFAEL